MSYSNVDLAGRVLPAHSSTPPRSGTFGDVVVDLAAVFGLDLDGTQTLAIDQIMSVDDLDQWAALETAVIMPRQNGKSVGILMPIALYVAASKPAQLIVWSAHRYKTSHEAFLAMLKLYHDELRPEFKKLVAKVSYSNGEEEFLFKNGSRIIFVARSQASGRGLSGDVVILDEALFLNAAMMGALFPTLSARPNPLVIYASSAGLATSDILQDVRDRGRAGDDPSLVYLEWCAPEGGCVDPNCDHAKAATGCALDDPANWILANPAVSAGRMSITYLTSERRALPVAEFKRERMGWWDSAARGGLFHMPTWFKCNDPQSQPGSSVTFAVHTTPDRRWSSIAVGSVRGDGVTHVEVVARREGVSWVVPWLTQRVETHSPAGIVLAGSMAAGTMAVDLEQLNGFRALASADVRRACASFFDAVQATTIANPGDPDLDIAIMAASRSSARGEWVFDAADGAELDTLYAVALAAWACRTDIDAEVSIYFFNDLEGDASDDDDEAESTDY